jgi:TPR repeat protein
MAWADGAPKINGEETQMQRRSFLSQAAAVVLPPAIVVNAARAQALAPNHVELEKAALDAGPAGMFALGRSYQLGAGVPINYAQAVVWLQKAVDAGHAQAMTVLGVMYHKAAGVPHDEARSQALIARAFALGDPHALALQAITRPPPEKAQLLQRAAEASDPFALMMQHFAKANTTEERETRRRAIQAYRPLADLGDLDALEGLLYIHPAAPDPMARIEVAQQLIMSGDLAVQAGNSFAAIQVANAHMALNAIRGTRSNTIPLQWLRKAETMGNPHAAQQIPNLSAQ